MQTTEVKLLSNTTNAPVIQLPNRAYPGIVIQGDTLKILCDLTESIRAEVIATSHKGELGDIVDELLSILNGYRSVYETTLRKANLAFPYSDKEKPSSTQ